MLKSYYSPQRHRREFIFIYFFIVFTLNIQARNYSEFFKIFQHLFLFLDFRYPWTDCRTLQRDRYL